MRALLLFVSFLPLLAQATTTSFIMIKMPVCLSDESEKFPPIVILDVPVLRADGAPDHDFGHICDEYVPRSTVKWAEPGNVNIAAAYGIAITAEMPPGGKTLTLTIDASSAQKPEDSPHSIEQVMDAVEKCVKLMEGQILPGYKKTIVRKPAPWTEAQVEQEAKAFAERVKGTVWDKFGNFQVQRIMFDGEKLHSLTLQNEHATLWDKTHVDEPYRLHVDYKDGTSSWYFIDSDDLHLINCKVKRWWGYQRKADGWADSTHGPFPRLRLSGRTIELDSQKGETLALPVVDVGYRASEFLLPDGRLFWAFSALTNKQIWLLEVKNVFGGKVCGKEMAPKWKIELPQEFPEREKRLTDFIFQLRSADKWQAGDTLSREMIRRTNQPGRTASDRNAVRAILGYSPAKTLPAR